MHGQFLSMFGADPARWAKRFSLDPFTAPCGECGAPLETTVPIACGDLRGLRAPACKCGNVHTPYCVVAAHGDLLEE